MDTPRRSDRTFVFSVLACLCGGAEMNRTTIILIIVIALLLGVGIINVMPYKQECKRLGYDGGGFSIYGGGICYVKIFCTPFVVHESGEYDLCEMLP